MPRDCETLGHIKVGHDALCLSCDAALNAKSFISVHIPADRAFDELPEDSVATIATWGPLGTDNT